MSGQVHDHRVLFMDEAEGVPYYFERCPRPDGSREYHDNIKPYFFQGHVPANLADTVVEASPSWQS